MREWIWFPPALPRNAAQLFPSWPWPQHERNLTAPEGALETSPEQAISPSVSLYSHRQTLPSHFLAARKVRIYLAFLLRFCRFNLHSWHKQPQIFHQPIFHLQTDFEAHDILISVPFRGYIVHVEKKIFINPKCPCAFQASANMKFRDNMNGRWMNGWLFCLLNHQWPLPTVSPQTAVSREGRQPLWMNRWPRIIIYIDHMIELIS